MATCRGRSSEKPSREAASGPWSVTPCPGLHHSHCLDGVRVADVLMTHQSSRVALGSGFRGF